MSRPVLLPSRPPAEPEGPKRTEAELRAIAERYQDFVENGVALAWSHGLDGVIQSANRAVLRGFGATEESQVVGRTILEFLEPRFRLQYEQYLRELQAKGEARGFATFRSFDGERRVVAYSNVLRRDEAGEPVVRGFGEVVTDFIRAQQGLERANRKLAESNRALEATNRVLERTNHELELLNEMGDLLQSARDQREAEDVLGSCLPRIFRRFAGAVYLDGAERSLFEPVARWGEPPPSDRALQVGECWALRRGRPHLADAAGGGPVCPHLTAESGEGTCPRAALDPKVQSLCVPLMAQGQALGLLHLRESLSAGGGAERDGLLSSRHLATNTAERLALALANLRLRQSLDTHCIRS
jgi:PAS domain S-box-containing protein